MDSSNLSSLPEESLEEETERSQQPEKQRHQQPRGQPPLPSAFDSVAHRPQSEFALNYLLVFHVYMAGTEGPVVFCLHGGGYSGLSFALSASKIKKKARVVAMDLRGQGKSSSENDLDLSVETMCNDVLVVIKEMHGEFPPAIVLVGHRLPTEVLLLGNMITLESSSMGGLVVVHVAAQKTLRTVAGLVVVEGTAMASLIHMQKILSSRMQHFPSFEKAIEWSVRGGSLRNIDSARVSIPSTLKYDDSKKCYVYRSQLEETGQYWRGWYEGLSEKFLSCPVPKLLLLAGAHRLDRSLTIGQMQGKFQMVVVRHTGHAIQMPGLSRPLQSQS